MIEEQEDVKDLIQRVEELALQYSYAHNGKPKVAGLLKLLMSEVCEKRIASKMKQVEDDKRFDPLYKERSDFSTRFIVEMIKSKLEEKGIQADILLEDKSWVGTYDVTVKSQKSSSEEEALTVRVEIKASMGLQLEQLQRYLLESSPLVLARVIQGQVLLVSQYDAKRLVEQTINMINSKIKRIKDGRPFVVPGPQCFGCAQLDCPFNRTRGPYGSSGIVTSSDADFNEEMHLFFRNLPIVAEKVASLVCDYLTSDKR